MNTVPNIRFTVDHMLIKLGKYLRILGYDAEWDPGIRTHELIIRANAEQRVFVTRNTRLPDQYPRPERMIAVESEDPVDQLAAVIEKTGLDTQTGLFSRCVRCNVGLVLVSDKEDVRDAVHPNVFKRFDTFYRCPSCGTVFWKGTHVRNTCRKLGIPAGDAELTADGSWFMVDGSRGAGRKSGEVE